MWTSLWIITLKNAVNGMTETKTQRHVKGFFSSVINQDIPYRIQMQMMYIIG